MTGIVNPPWAADGPARGGEAGAVRDEGGEGGLAHAAVPHHQHAGPLGEAHGGPVLGALGWVKSSWSLENNIYKVLR